MTVRTVIIFYSALYTILFASCASNDKKDNSQQQSISAEQQIKNEIHRYPDSLPLTQKLIQLYIDSSRYQDAIQVTDEAIKKDTSNGALWEIKATLLYQNEDTLGAIQAFEKAVIIYPIPDYVISLGSLYAQTKDKRALLLANQLLNDNPAKTAVDAYYIVGLYYTYTGDKLKAISYFDKCISMDYNNVYAYREKGIALYDLGRYNDAIQVLNRSVTVKSTFDEGYYWLGRCYEKLNKKEEAIQNYRTALMFDKNFIEAQQALDSLDK
ncbi:hypothetical protein BH09BAC2_BH09BAC2_17500 [soil metagenome]